MVSKDRAGEADKQDWFDNENLQITVSRNILCSRNKI